MESETRPVEAVLFAGIPERPESKVKTAGLTASATARRERMERRSGRGRPCRRFSGRIERRWQDALILKGHLFFGDEGVEVFDAAPVPGMGGEIMPENARVPSLGHAVKKIGGTAGMTVEAVEGLKGECVGTHLLASGEAQIGQAQSPGQHVADAAVRSEKERRHGHED